MLIKTEAVYYFTNESESWIRLFGAISWTAFGKATKSIHKSHEDTAKEPKKKLLKGK